MSSDDTGSTGTQEDPELTLAAVVRGETKINWFGLVVFLPGRVVMGALGVVVLAVHGTAGLLREEPTLGRSARSVPDEWTIYPVAGGAVLWTAGVLLLVASGVNAGSVVALALGWVTTTAAVALDVSVAGAPTPRLDRAAYLLAVGVPLSTGLAAAVYISGRMQRAEL